MVEEGMQPRGLIATDFGSFLFSHVADQYSRLYRQNIGAVNSDREWYAGVDRPVVSGMWSVLGSGTQMWQA
jgi:hypothetical protein